VIVPGTSDPWLAGMPPGSVASVTDVAPSQSPVQAIGLAIVPGTPLKFSASGLVSNGICGPPFCPFFGPDGGTKPDEFPLFHGTGPENGISDLGSPINALVGVFLGANAPFLSSPPPALDFNGALNQNYLTLSPRLQQVFFIGDGLANASVVQQVIVPFGATRLFLGTADGCCWSDNQGSFTVRIAQVPEPSMVVLLLIGMYCLLVWSYKRTIGCRRVAVPVQFLLAVNVRRLQTLEEQCGILSALLVRTTAAVREWMRQKTEPPAGALQGASYFLCRHPRGTWANLARYRHRTVLIPLRPRSVDEPLQFRPPR